MCEGAYALASKRRRAEGIATEFNDSDDDNYVELEKRNYLCTPSPSPFYFFEDRHWLKMKRMRRNKANLL
jgi:hypothetical protein